MRDNLVQFATVREDPIVESILVQKYKPERVLLVASGGCTALSLRAQFPHLALSLLDPNAHQISLVKSKIETLKNPNKAELWKQFNVGNNHSSGLSECGNFESLFRGLRKFIHDFVCPYQEFHDFFLKGNNSPSTFIGHLQNSPYWALAFELFFSDQILVTMFGPEAIQHAEPGSYPKYFQRVIEQGLARKDYKTNYFLHHILLGHYLDSPDCIPYFLTDIPENHQFEWLEMKIQALPGFSDFDLIQLSNIFDWMSDKDVDIICRRLKNEVQEGSIILIRQLNNETDIEELLGDKFVFEHELEKELLEQDRSLFYSAIKIGVKNGN